MIGVFSLRVSGPIVKIARSTAGVLGEKNELILIPRVLGDKRPYELVSESAIIFL